MPKTKTNLFKYYKGLTHQKRLAFRKQIFENILKETYRQRNKQDFYNWCYGKSQPAPIERVIINRVANCQLFVVEIPKMEIVETAAIKPYSELRMEKI